MTPQKQTSKTSKLTDLYSLPNAHDLVCTQGNLEKKKASWKEFCAPEWCKASVAMLRNDPHVKLHDIEEDHTTCFIATVWMDNRRKFERIAHVAEHCERREGREDAKQEELTV